MSRRTNQLFSLSLLDLLTSALGAIIFLFIITPKGGESAAQTRQAMVYFDTTQMKIHGDLPDSLLGKSEGDTLYTVLLAYKDLPIVKPTKPERKFVYNEPRPKPKPKEPVVTPPRKPEPVKKDEPKAKEPEKKPEPKPELPPEKPAPPKPPVYKGDAPSVPCNVSIELNWESRDDNIDLFVCKGNECVYGGRKRNKQIGQWDSGKSRNRLFGNDLRTNQEAVRQFDEIIPGEYKIYAEFKDSKANRESVVVKGLIFTKDEATGQERGESFTRNLEMDKGRTHIATIILNEDGSYIMQRP